MREPYIVTSILTIELYFAQSHCFASDDGPLQTYYGTDMYVCLIMDYLHCIPLRRILTKNIFVKPTSNIDYYL